MRLIFTSLLLVGMFFGYANFTHISEVYYEDIDSGQALADQAHEKIHRGIDTLISPAKSAYDSAISVRQEQVQSNLQ